MVQTLLVEILSHLFETRMSLSELEVWSGDLKNDSEINADAVEMANSVVQTAIEY